MGSVSGNILINDGGTGELSFVMWGVVCESLSVYRLLRSPNAGKGGRVGVGSGPGRFRRVEGGGAHQMMRCHHQKKFR